jgi:hypothetical protein
VTAITAGSHEFLVAFICDLGEVGIGIFQRALAGAFGGCRRRSGCGFTGWRWSALLSGRLWLLRRIVCECGTEKANAEDGGDSE